MIINTIIDHYHNIKINTKGNLIIAPVTWALQFNHLQFYPPNIFFHSRPLFVIWYRNQKERKHADHAEKMTWLEHFSNILPSRWLTLLSLFLRSCKLRGWRCTIWKIRLIPPAIIFKSSRELLLYFRRFKGNFLSCYGMTLWFCFSLLLDVHLDDD